MPVSTDELIQVINSYAPRDLEEDWDNSGWQINLASDEVKRILVSLEITDAVIDEAENIGADFILTHHPLIFGNLDVVDCNSATGNYIARLIKNNQSVYSTHTSFDSAFGGINDDLAERVGLQKIRKLHMHKPNGDPIEIMGRMGDYESEKTLAEVCDIVKNALKMEMKLIVVGDPKAKIRKVAVCGGAGGDAISGLINNHCDLFITGEVRHHEAQMAKEGNLCVINAGHFSTERFFAENMGEKLKSHFINRVEIIESSVCVEAFHLI